MARTAKNPVALPITLDHASPACEKPWDLILMCLVFPEKQVYTVMDLQGAFFSFIGSGETTHLFL